MEKIRNSSPKYINGKCVSYAIFWCNDCKQEVERRLSAGKMQKSCGSLECKENKTNPRILSNKLCYDREVPLNTTEPKSVLIKKKQKFKLVKYLF